MSTIVRGNEAFEAAAKSFCCLFRNLQKDVILGRSLTTDLALPFGCCLSFDMMLPTSLFPANHHSDEGRGRPAWLMEWDSYPSHLLIKVRGTRNMRVWR